MRKEAARVAGGGSQRGQPRNRGDHLLNATVTQRRADGLRPTGAERRILDKGRTRDFPPMPGEQESHRYLRVAGAHSGHSPGQSAAATSKAIENALLPPPDWSDEPRESFPLFELQGSCSALPAPASSKGSLSKEIPA